MNILWKVVLVAAALLLLPLSAYAVGNLTSPSDRAVPDSRSAPASPRRSPW